MILAQQVGLIQDAEIAETVGNSKCLQQSEWVLQSLPQIGSARAHSLLTAP